MLRSYVVIALRNLMRDKVVTSINIVGLSVAIAVSAILGLGVHGALTADWNLREDDRLFRVVAREIAAAGHIQRPAYQSEDLAAALAETFPEIASTTRVISTSVLMTVGERHLEHSVVEVDLPFLQMFHYALTAGNPATVLDGLDQVVISKRLAERMFGDEFRDYPELVGRQIVLHGNEGPEAYTVAGVFADLPKKRSLDFDAAIRFENRTKYGMASYWGATASTPSYSNSTHGPSTRPRPIIAKIREHGVILLPSGSHSKRSSQSSPASSSPHSGNATKACAGRTIQTPSYSNLKTPGRSTSIRRPRPIIALKNP